MWGLCASKQRRVFPNLSDSMILFGKSRPSVPNAGSWYPQFRLRNPKVQPQLQEGGQNLLPQFPFEVLGWFESSALSTQSKHLLWALPAWDKPSLFQKFTGFRWGMHCWGGQEGCSLPAPQGLIWASHEVLPMSSVTAGVTKIKLEINSLKHRRGFGQSWGAAGIAFWKKKKIAFCLLQIRQSSALVMFSPWFLLGCRGISKGRG